MSKKKESSLNVGKEYKTKTDFINYSVGNYTY